MRQKLTAAHWGCYRLDESGDAPVLLPLERDPRPSPIGSGWLAAMTDPATRIARPAIRRGWLERRDPGGRGSDGFVEVDWDRALDLVAQELGRVRTAHGNAAIFAGSYGWASAGRFHHAQSQLRRFLNTVGGYTGSRNTYSHAAAEVLLPHITGMTNAVFQEQMTSWPLIAEHCQLLVAFGGISGRTAQITSGGTSAHEVEGWLARAVANGLAVVNVSPRRSDMRDVPGAEWLPIRPGTDTALMLGLAHALMEAGAHDTDFLARCTSGWETVAACLTGQSDGIAKSADWAAPICDVPAAEIRALALRMARQRTMLTVAWSLQRADHGEQPLWMGLTLAAMLGQIGRPGTGFGFGYGSLTPVGRPERFHDWPALPQGHNPIPGFIPVARIADMLLSPGAPFAFDGGTHVYPDARLVWWAGGNPFHHHQDLFRLERAWARPETVIVSETSWTATARRADIVLPASSSLERADIMMNRRDPALVWMDPLIPRYAQARDEHDYLADLAERMGTRAAFTEGREPEGWLRWLWDGARQVAGGAGFSLPGFDDFRAAGIFECPDNTAHRIQLGDFVADPQAHPLATESGRITLANAGIAAMGLADCPGHPAWLPPAEWLDGRPGAALHLISGQPEGRLHSQLDPGPVSAAGKIGGREVCTLHPAAALARGIAPGDLVLLENERGACLAAAALSEDIRPDCIALPTGAWFDPQEVDGRRIEVHGNPNVLTLDKGCSALSQGNSAHTALARVSRWEGAAPPLRVFGPPDLSAS